MGAIPTLLIAYLVGGITFIPAVVLLVLIHFYFTAPYQDLSNTQSKQSAFTLHRSDDDEHAFSSGKSAQSLADKYQRSYEPDAAHGYFAVCREYVPGGVNGKPPERTTPAGAVIATESPSVYQSMYRSLFDRRQPLTLDAAKANGKSVKRARNVFFVVLRHGHLMLYEHSEHTEVKHVISLEHHDVSVYGGGEEIPEGELWIKRNAIRLMRKPWIEGGVSRPFFLFSDNCSEKEDFYFALLHNQEIKAGANDNPPQPLQYDPRHIIGLVQRLHSSEEQLQTRWVNGLLGRLFLALYKTANMEEFIRKKVTKKIARAKKPAFMSGIVLQGIDMGESAPQITNPRLKDLTIDGDCCVEADLKYNGNFRLEIAATARLDLGARFRAREVNLVLAVVVKKLNGHGMLRFKTPPSNRVWMAFERMPDMELSIEPIVSSRQITYSLILKAIESRIREVVAETIVLPHWDDSPFTDTIHQRFRGGLWTDQLSTTVPEHVQTKIPDESPEDEADLDLDKGDDVASRKQNQRTASVPSLLESANESAPSKAPQDSPGPHLPEKPEVTSPISTADKPPKALRSTSFASAADPLVSNANADSVHRETRQRTKHHENAASSMIAISNRSRPSSPTEVPNSTPPDRHLGNLCGEEKSRDSRLSQSSESADSGTSDNIIVDSPLQGPASPTATSIDSASMKSGPDGHAAKSSETPSRQSTGTSANKKQSMAALGAATAAAKKWGWGVLARNGEQRNGAESLDPKRAGTPANPIGRGQPLPPVGQPLPSPNAHRAKTMPLAETKRKPLPPGLVVPHEKQGHRPRSPSKPPLPARHRQSSSTSLGPPDDGLLVVQAPVSEPSSPTDEAHDKALFASDRKDVSKENENSALASPKNAESILESKEVTSNHYPPQSTTVDDDISVHS
ncbi:MAG: hypothetical protein OHK93_006208 [Ramalina farinacea]|uniref:SMP-LTD domain-containing protein n=1 Tax=Ramalina farinacea TaxID=258253 RepID=A0AA43TPW2_9LECA|nr:hypothetical protein [Ramalina farinacea]